MKHWKKKTGALILSLCLLLGMFPMAVAAEEAPAAQVGEAAYATLAAAIAAVSENGTEATVVTLLKDVQEQVTIPKEKKIVLNLNGKTLSDSSAKSGTLVNLGELTVCNRSVEKTGTIVNTEKQEGTSPMGIWNMGELQLESGTVNCDSYRAIYNAGSNCTLTMTGGKVEGKYGIYANVAEVSISGGEVCGTTQGIYIRGNDAASGHETPKQSVVTVSGNAQISATGESAIALRGNGAVLNVAGGTITGGPGFGAIDGNGTVNSNKNYGGTVINISGGTILGRGTDTTSGLGIYHPQDGELNVTGGVIMADTGIEIRSGKLNVSGDAEITGTMTPLTARPNGNGSTTNGAGIAVAQHTTKQAIEVEISGGVISGYSALYESNPENNPETDIKNVKISISGGKFKSINGGTQAVYSEDVVIPISGGNFTSLPEKYALAEGKAVLPSEIAGYTYTIGEKPETKVVPAEPKVDVAPTVDEETAKAVQEALVSEKTSLEGQGLEVQVNDVASKNQETPADHVEALQKVVSDATADNTKIVVQPFMDIKITGADQTDGSKTLTLDITPMYRTVATTADIENDAPIIVEGETGKNAIVVGNPAPLEITGAVTVSLPLPANFVSGETRLYVNHEKNGRTYIYTGSVDSNVLTFSNPHGFSQFTITSEGPAAGIGQVGYPSLQAAVDAVQNGEVITVLKTGETARVSRTVTFYAQAAADISFTMEAGANTTAGADNGTDGKYVFTRRGSGGEEVPEEWQNPFTDVKEKDWFYPAVKFVHENDLFRGTTNTTFAPGLTMERGMLATVLYRLEQEPAVGSAPFADVKEGAYYADAVSWAASQKIVEGYGDGTFGPGDPVTREQLAAVLYRYAKYKGWDVSGSASLDSFTDSGTASGYAKEALAWAVDSGILKGYGNGLLNPKGSATRAEVAQMLQRFCDNYQAE